MNRAEEIKQNLKKNEATKNQKEIVKRDNSSIWLHQNVDKLNLDSDEDETEPNTTKNLANLSRNSTKAFTKHEIDVLRRGSFINNRYYVPFFPEIDTKEKFFLPLPFTDKDGKLALSKSQQERFSKWARPDEIFDNPTLMMLVSSFSVKQTCISDCKYLFLLLVFCK